MTNFIHYYIPTEDLINNQKLDSGFSIHAFEEDMGLTAKDILGQEFVQRTDGQFQSLTVKFNVDYVEEDVEEMYITTIDEVREWEKDKEGHKDRGLPLSMFPNYLGINLCSVEGQHIKRVKSTQELIEVRCVFTPITEEDEGYDSYIMDPDRNSNPYVDFQYGKPKEEFLELIQPYLV